MGGRERRGDDSRRRVVMDDSRAGHRMVVSPLAASLGRVIVRATRLSGLQYSLPFSTGEVRLRV